MILDADFLFQHGKFCFESIVPGFEPHSLIRTVGRPTAGVDCCILGQTDDMQDGGADVAGPSVAQRNFGLTLCSHRVLHTCLVLMPERHGITRSGAISVSMWAAQKSPDQRRFRTIRGDWSMTNDETQTTNRSAGDIKKSLALLLFLSSLHLSQCERGVADDGLHVATFSVEITPRLGKPVGLGFIPILKRAEHPLLARGILLKDSGVACVICTLDLMEVHNESYDFLRQTIAKAARVPKSHVALHCIHQHTAPAISTAAQRLDLKQNDPRRIATADYLLDMAKKLTTAIHASQKNWQQVTHIGRGRSKVERVASNRRLKRADGSIQGRSSSTKSSPRLRKLPEGLIDPWVRTISLDNGDRTVAFLHYYASHPQSFYGDGRVSYDVPGIVRKRLEKTTGAFQLYLTGCGGDVAFGKYNDGSRKARSGLVERLHVGIKQSIASLKPQPVESMMWSVKPISFPLRTDKEFSETANRRILNDPNAASSRRRKAAIALAWIERVKAGKPVELSCLSIGRVQMLHLPGEPFVQYQLAAQKMQPNRFVCVAGYGDCGMGYIGGDRIFVDRGGYEQTYSFAGPCEELFLSAIKRLLTVKADNKRRSKSR